MGKQLMKRTYQYVSDFAVVLFTSPDGLTELESDIWADMFLDAVVRNPQEYHLDDVVEEETHDTTNPHA
jgi:hypothetical protein